VASGVLFGSQFFPGNACPDFEQGAYNISMSLAILIGSVVALALLGTGPISPGLALVCAASGVLWVLGNYLLLVSVALAGMARAFVAINFSAVLSFAGGMLFLGELRTLDGSRLLVALGAVGLVLLGAWLVTTTTPRRDTAGPDTRGRVVRGLLAGFVATIFFSAYNVLTAWVLNRRGVGAGPTFVAVAPGIVVGAFLAALFSRRPLLRHWRRAPARWHLLAAAQGLIWATAMVCIMFGWRGAGIAVGTAVQVGTQTLVGAVWGIARFGEFDALPDRRGAFLRFAAGAALTVAGITTIGFV
jgi:glucose uptake protein GlcU